MSLKDFQKQVDDWVKQYKTPYWQPQWILARLIEETGELAREINHLHGPKPKKPTEDKKELGLEISDILYTLICLANSQGIDLDKSWEEMMSKYQNRDRDRYDKK